MADQVIDKPVFLIGVRKKVDSLIRPISGALNFEVGLEFALDGSVYEVPALGLETSFSMELVGRLNPMLADLAGRSLASLKGRPISKI